MNNISTSILDPMVIQLNIARAAVQQIAQPILFTIGIIGCILNILIFTRPSMRQNSCAIYFHANSWANFSCLTWGVLASMLAFFTKNNPAAYNVVYCKIRFYMINFSQWASRAFVILACSDRFFLCSTSVHQRNFCRPIIAKKVIVLTTFICACLPIYILVTYQPGQQIIPCYLTTIGAQTLETVFIWVFTLTIPILSMSIFSGLIIRRLKQNAKRVGREKLHIAGKDIHLVGMLIGQVMLYLITNLPYGSVVLYGLLTQSIAVSNKSPERIASETFANTFLASFLYYCFNGLSFFVYTLTAPSFRRELLSIILPRQWLRERQQNTLSVKPLNTGTLNLRRITKTEEKINHRTNKIHPDRY